MISSSVYGFETYLDQICATLIGYGYDVMSSYMGTIKTDPRLSNLENCVNAVDECDAFIGIIRTDMGTGNIGDKNITMEEMKRAIQRSTPRWFFVDERVPFARNLQNNLTPPGAKIRKSRYFDPLSIDAYNLAISDTVAVPERKGNWVQPFHALPEILSYLRTNFSDPEYINSIIKEQTL